MEFECRYNSQSLKYDAIAQRFGSTSKTVLPMWVADIDTPPPSSVTQALRHHINNTHYGYQAIDIHSAVAAWHTKRGWPVSPASVVPANSVINAMCTAITLFTAPGDRVMVFTPVYGPFVNIIRETGREVSAVGLSPHNGSYTFDPTHLDADATMVLFCNPQNPTGTLWTQSQLDMLGKFCVANDIVILSDDVHSEFVFDSQTYTPLASLSDSIAATTLTFQSPAKTYNLAQIPAACYAVVPDPTMRSQLASALQTRHQEPGGLAALSLKLAYQTNTQQWQCDVISIIARHRQIMRDTLTGTGLMPVFEHATYFIWLNLSALLPERINAAQWLFKNTGIAANDGEGFGCPGWVRVNIACPTPLVKQAAVELSQLVQNLQPQS